ncbi:MAG: zinc ribbon domain-containing protein [Dehalococcoidia bacterium]|nr:zinc ribbon domain-containing protein [Dehalococcoidia bacterium]
MPTYEFRCKKCSNLFELRRALAARDDAAPCPACKSRSTSRVIIQRLNVMRGARPNAAAGEGEPEDFLDGGADDFGGHGHGGGGHEHGGDWDDDF